MISKAKYDSIKKRVLDYYVKAGTALTDSEKESVEISDMGLNDIDTYGLQLIIYINTQRVCVKEMVLLPGQTCPEHRHPPLGPDSPGKEETFRCRYGSVYLYVEGDPTKTIKAKKPAGEFNVFHEVVLNQAEQYTIMPNMRHWFQAGPDGAVISEFSTHSTDEADIFSDKRIIRAPEVE